MQNLVGQTLGQYQIVVELGRGGMATVYKAYHPGLAVYRAIKVIHPELSRDTAFKERFQREAQAAAALRHPHIIQIHDFGVANNLYYMVMEFIEGQDLSELLAARGPIRPLTDAVQIIDHVASALSYAHQRGVIHRDIKPANIMLNREGQAILTDFGIAKMVSGQKTQLTEAGSSIGTPAFMAPEQISGQPVTPASDIYALGVVVYQMMTGVLPFNEETPLALMYKVVSEAPTPPRQHTPDIPESLQAVILKATAKEPSQRHATAVELAQSVRTSLSLPVTTAPGMPVPVTHPVSRPRTLWWGVGAMIGGGMALCLCLLIMAYLFWPRPPSAIATWQIIVDASAGMNETIEGQAKMDLARIALSDEIDILPNNVSAGLRIFGGETSNLAPCEDTVELVAPNVNQADDLATALATITPAGEAPLTEAIVQAIGAFDLSEGQRNTLIIITAGVDSCEANALEQLQLLSQRLDIQFDLHLIGLGVEQAERDSLAALSQAMGGKYYDARSAEEIGQVLADLVAVLQGTPAAATPTASLPAVDPLTNVSNDPDVSENARLVVDAQGTAHLIWRDLTDPTTNNGDLYYRQRPSGGDWSEPEYVNEGFAYLFSLSSLLLNPAGGVCAFWDGSLTSSTGMGFYQRCRSESGWGEAEFLYRQGRDYLPALTPAGEVRALSVVNAGTLYLGDQLLYESDHAYDPAFTIDANGVYHAVWILQEDPFTLRHALSRDEGNTWSEPELLADHTVLGNPTVMADSSGRVHLIWNEPLTYRVWEDSTGWSEPVTPVVGISTSGSSSLGLAVNREGLAYVAWQNTALWLIRQQPDGTWTEPLMIASVEGTGRGPSVVVDDQGQVHLAWESEGQEGASDIFYTIVRQE